MNIGALAVMLVLSSSAQALDRTPETTASVANSSRLSTLVSPHTSLEASQLELGTASSFAKERFPYWSAESTIDVALIRAPRISPDGEWAVYQVERANATRNEYTCELRVSRISTPVSSDVIYTESPSKSRCSRATNVSWSPDSQDLVYEAEKVWFVFSVKNHRSTMLTDLIPKLQSDLPKGISDLSWSPDGQMLAFLAPSGMAPPPPDLSRGVEVDENWNPMRVPEERTTLQSRPDVGVAIHVLDLRAEQVKQITSSDQRVASYAWAPDGMRIAYSAGPSSGGLSPSATAGDIYVADLRTRGVVAVTAQPGGDGRPVWSPDGEWLAFPSQRGVEDYRFNFSLAIARSDGSSAPFYPAERYEESKSLGPSSIQWSSTGMAILFAATSEMRGQLFEVDLKGTYLRTIFGGNSLEHAGQFTFDKNAAKAVFVRQSPTQPSELWTLNLIDGTVQQVTRFNAAAPEDMVPSSREYAWNSSDGRWKIHGIMLLPPSYSPRKRYPLLVYLEGGPAQVSAGFSNGQYPLLTFASRGYVVLIPNTRGRGGYGRKFDGAIEAERSFTDNPYLDVMAGVNALIEQGIVDPEQMGVAGFSYGATLGGYIITQTSRFKGASLGDGSIEKTTDVLKEGSLPWVSLLLKHQEGVGDLYHQAERIRYENQFALGHIQKVRTPSLILTGIDSSAPTQGRMFLHAFRRMGVPAELIVFPRTGHGIHEPELLLDSHERNLEWFDHWVRGISSARMASRYGNSYKTESGE